MARADVQLEVGGHDPNTGNADGTGRQLFPDSRIPADRIDPAAQKMLQLAGRRVAADPDSGRAAAGSQRRPD